MKKIDIPVKVVGPGSQPEESDGAVMNFMDLPSGMETYEAPIVPEPEDSEGLEAAMELSVEILKGLQNFSVGDKSLVYELNPLNAENRAFFNQLLNEGEVSIQCLGNINAVIQESVLAGLWRVQYQDDQQAIIRDTLEVGVIPGVVSELTFADAQQNIEVDNLQLPENIYNAAPLLTEIHDQLKNGSQAKTPHVINLSLLPHNDEDIAYLSDQLGIGPVVILSRGYGNCRISSTGTENVWWVQYFNSQETLILNTIEIGPVPDVACASQEDLDDSAERLREILSVYE